MHTGNWITGYKQIKGIPIGGSCSSVLADIYFYMYEGHIAANEEIKNFFICTNNFDR